MMWNYSSLWTRNSCKMQVLESAKKSQTNGRSCSKVCSKSWEIKLTEAGLKSIGIQNWFLTRCLRWLMWSFSNKETRTFTEERKLQQRPRVRSQTWSRWCWTSTMGSTSTSKSRDSSSSNYSQSTTACGIPPSKTLINQIRAKVLMLMQTRTPWKKLVRTTMLTQ